MFPYEFYRHCGNQFKGEKWYHLILHKFFYNGNILKYRGDPLGILYVLWDKKKFDKNVKTLAATDILCIKFFDTWVFLNPRTAPVWLITALWDRIFSKENRVTAHLCIKTVGAPNLLIHWRFPHENFWHCETINSDKTVIPSYSAWKFSVPRTFSKHGRVPLRIFSSLWNKNKSTENLDAVPPSSPSNFF